MESQVSNIGATANNNETQQNSRDDTSETIQSLDATSLEKSGKIDETTKSDIVDNQSYTIKDSQLSHSSKNNKVNETSEKCGHLDKQIDNEHEDDSENQEKSLNSTAFTVSFEDENIGFKRLGIRDSIRKYAPPKIFNKPTARAESNDTSSHENTLMSIDSATTNITDAQSKSYFNRSTNYRHSQSSKHSNISESAAYLIDKWLQSEQTSKNESSTNIRDPNPDADFPDDRSDNGTYIVGSDRDTEAERQKIDETFGITSPDESNTTQKTINKISNQKSVLSKQVNNQSNAQPSSTRSNASIERSVIDRSRQEHINRLARNPSRSSSSTRQDNHNQSINDTQRASSRQSRNSSCDRRSSSDQHYQKHKRSVSQSSKHSQSSLRARDSHPRQSDGESTGSRSSLHTQPVEPSSQTKHDWLEQQTPNVTNRMFNRTVVLRRARLGLGEPAKANDGSLVSSPTILSPRRQISNNQARAGSASGSNNFHREDGGRYSLRSKNNFVNTRPTSFLPNHRSPQHQRSTADSSYQSRYIAPSIRAGSQKQASSHNHSWNQPNLEDLSELANCDSIFYRIVTKAPNHMHLRSPSDLHESDHLESNNYASNQYSNNYSNLADYEPSSLTSGFRTSSCSDQRTASRFGALDNLVISAISSLTCKIRHSVCDVLMEHAKRLPVDNQTRSIVEEILPQLSVEVSENPRSPTNLDNPDHSPNFELSKTLRNLKKVEQMVEVISLITNQLSSASSSPSPQSSNTNGVRERNSSPKSYSSSSNCKKSDPSLYLGSSSRANLNESP